MLATYSFASLRLSPESGKQKSWAKGTEASPPHSYKSHYALPSDFQELEMGSLHCSPMSLVCSLSAEYHYPAR